MDTISILLARKGGFGIQLEDHEALPIFGIVLAAILVGCLVYVCQVLRRAFGPFHIDIDPDDLTVTLRRKSFRKGTVSLRIADLCSIEVARKQGRRFMRPCTKYAPIIRWKTDRGELREATFGWWTPHELTAARLVLWLERKIAPIHPAGPDWQKVISAERFEHDAKGYPHSALSGGGS